MVTRAKPGQMGPMTVTEVARGHNLSKAAALSIAQEAGVDPDRWEFGYMTRSDARKFIRVMYQRLGLKVKPGKAPKTGAPGLKELECD